MKKLFFLIILNTYILCLSTNKAYSQELPPPSDDILNKVEGSSTPDTPTLDPILPEDFTGTLAEDDPENIANEILQDNPDHEDEKMNEDENNNQEGDNENQPDEQDKPLKDDETEIKKSHSIKIEFTSHVKFFKWLPQEKGYIAAEEAYMEIEYQNRCEIPIDLKETKTVSKVNCNFDINHWGSLANNEYFDCRLDIAIDQMPVETICRLQKESVSKNDNENEINDEEIEIVHNLACKFEFGKVAKESWFSFCTDFASGATLNTEGEKEEYNLKIIEQINPSLKSLLVEDFELLNSNKVELTAGPILIEDSDITNDIRLSGEGSLTIEPIE